MKIIRKYSKQCSFSIKTSFDSQFKEQPHLYLAWVAAKKGRNPEGGGGGLLWISSDGDDQRILWGFTLKFSILGFFWVGKFGKYFFVWLHLNGDFIRDFLGVFKTI